MKSDPLSRHIGTRVAGRYRVTSELSRGGMGVVFRAVQEPLEREIALKIMLPGPAADQTLRRRFIQEAQALSRTVHPNIVTIFDFGEVDDGSLFIAMELVHGKNLRELQAGLHRVPWRDTVQLAIGAARALAAAHGAGITHRDLKPDNVMLSGNRWRADDVKLLDFGLARTLGAGETDGLTQLNVIPGTPHYIAPERVSSRVDDPRSDLYALGAIWFELLTGKLPFDGETVAAILLAHVQKSVPLVSQVAPELGVPAELERFVARLMAKNPAERWADARAFLAELEGAVFPGGVSPPASSASVPRPSRWTSSAHNRVSPARFPTPTRPEPRAPASAPAVPSPRAAELQVGGEPIRVEHEVDEGRRRLICVAIFRGRLLRKVEVELPALDGAKLRDWLDTARADFSAGLRGLAAKQPPLEAASPPRAESAETRLFFFALDSWQAGDRDTAIRTLESLRTALPEDTRIANTYKALLLEPSRG